MFKIHFIAIGGSAMHNLAIALFKKGYKVSGSDDEIFEPSKSRLKKYGLFPEKPGWHPDKITDSTDAVILGMHARIDNPELLKAQEIGIKIYSYPEFLYQQTKNKTRVVIGGSHGKTTITSMVMHVLKQNNIRFDFMVGASLDGFETMVELSDDTKIAVFEGDEYLSSPIDRRPKFHLYKPNIALLTGIAWDHINVFPTFEIYIEQFSKFVNKIEDNGTLFFYKEDKILQEIVARKQNKKIDFILYNTHESIIKNESTFLKYGDKEIQIQVFGTHNLQNISGAKMICNKLGVTDVEFYNAIQSFKGASRRLEVLSKNDYTVVFHDFAHSPSKLEATINAVKMQYPERELIACMELHTFSSLNKGFLPEYNNCMNGADRSYVFFSPRTVEHKNLEPISEEIIYKTFNKEGLKVFTDSEKLLQELINIDFKNKNLLLMSSGNFGGIDLRRTALKLTRST